MTNPPIGASESPAWRQIPCRPRVSWQACVGHRAPIPSPRLAAECSLPLNDAFANRIPASALTGSLARLQVSGDVGDVPCVSPGAAPSLLQKHAVAFPLCPVGCAVTVPEQEHLFIFIANHINWVTSSHSRPNWDSTARGLKPLALQKLRESIPLGHSLQEQSRQLQGKVLLELCFVHRAACFTLW